jgi:hypothetical protein
MSFGYIYLLKIAEDLVKVGYTVRAFNRRYTEYPMVDILAVVYVQDPITVEAIVRLEFGNKFKRVKASEYFECNPMVAAIELHTIIYTKVGVPDSNAVMKPKKNRKRKNKKTAIEQPVTNVVDMTVIEPPMKVVDVTVSKPPVAKVEKIVDVTVNKPPVTNVEKVVKTAATKTIKKKSLIVNKPKKEITPPTTVADIMSADDVCPPFVEGILLYFE